MFARFDENPAMTLQDIKETKRDGRTDGRTDGHTDGCTDGQRENSIPTTNKVCGGYKELSGPCHKMHANNNSTDQPEHPSNLISPCYSFSRKYNSISGYMQDFSILASLCSRAILL